MRARGLISVRLWVGVGAVLACSAAWGQAPAQKCDSSARDAAKCPPAAPAPSAAQRFPFPGEEPAPAKQPDAPSAAGSQARPKSTPPAYPGDPEAPQAAAGKPRTPPAYPGDPEAGKTPADDFSSSSSSSSSGRTDDPTDGANPLADAGSTGDNTKAAGGRLAKRRKLPKIDAQTPEARESEDLDVADFYTKDGNFGAAYARAKDAVSIMPNDPFAQFALAEASRKLNKADEAREHYSAVLKLDPNPKQQKASERALAELGGAGEPK